MIIKKSVLKRIIIRITAFVLALAFAPSLLCLDEFCAWAYNKYVISGKAKTDFMIRDYYGKVLKYHTGDDIVIDLDSNKAAMISTTSASGNSFREESINKYIDTTASASKGSSQEEENNNANTIAGSEKAPAVTENGKEVKTEKTTGADWEKNSITSSEEPKEKALDVKTFNQEAASYNINDGNIYTLTVSTGMSPGSSVGFFVLRYIDNNGDEQKKYIFPEHSLKASHEYLHKRRMLEENNGKGPFLLIGTAKRPCTIADINNKINRYSKGDSVSVIIDTDPYELESYINIDAVEVYNNGAEKNVPGTTRLDKRHGYLSALGYKVNDIISNTTPLTAWSIDDYLFEAENGIKKVISIEAFMTKGTWSVQGMAVSRVTRVGDNCEYGFYSGKYFFDLGKNCIAALKSKRGRSVAVSTAVDSLISIGGEDDSSVFSVEESSDSNSDEDRPMVDDLYTFRIDFADKLDSGIETLLKTSADSAVSSPSNGFTAEHMALEVEYKDKNNFTRTVTMPVLLSVLGQYMESKDKVSTIGIAQRGETIAFTACLPEYENLISTKLYVGSAAREMLKKTGGFELTAPDERKIKQLDSDNVSIAGISMYKGTCRMSNTKDAVEPKLESYTYTFDFSEKYPEYYMTTSNPDGIVINPGKTEEIKLTKYTQGSALLACKYDKNLLIRIKTDDIAGACTTGSVKLRLTYQDTSGAQFTTPFYNIKDEVMDYLGYWPTTSNVKDNFGYIYGMSRGNIVEFPVMIKDVATVNNIEIDVESNSSDWQISGISIAAINSISRRHIFRQNITVDQKSTAFRIARSIEKTVISPFPINTKMLIMHGELYKFETGTGMVITSDEVDFSKVENEMNYEQTKMNYGFAKTRYTYDVSVKVADDPDANNINGDSGSRNYFYFQLVFASGKSGVVLANQQLSADAFRAGYEESFSISVNRDYGELKSLRIIPQDIDEDAQIFDKLNIEYITVTEQTTTGISDQYVFDNVGWIGIDYHDKSQESTVKVKSGRYAAEICREKSYSYKQKVTNLLCEISTRPWKSKDDLRQPEASVCCDLEYVDANGKTKTVSFDVISRMAAYMKKTPISFEGKADGSNVALYTNMKTVSDPRWMLRPNTTDRFIMPPIADLKSIIGMTLYATSRNNKPAEWVLGNVTISQIMTDSKRVFLNDRNEYERDLKKNERCKMIMPEGRTEESMLITAGDVQRLKIMFDKNMFPLTEKDRSISAVTRLPSSTNDTVNLFVFPSKGSKSISSVNANVKLEYCDSKSQNRNVDQSVLRIYGDGTEDAMFYSTGLSAPDMSNLSWMSLFCPNSYIFFDHAIIQQVREGVVVATYYVNFGNIPATMGLRVSPSNSIRGNENRRQTIMLSLGEQTKESSLFGLSEHNMRPNDIAVALEYRSSLDPSGNKYFSNYVYFTDAGINKIRPGLMAELTYEIPYAAEITGYRICSFGSVQAQVNAALVKTYSFSKTETDPQTGKTVYVGEKAEDTYCFDKSYAVENAIRLYNDPVVKGMDGDHSLTPVELDFITAKAAESKECGTNSKVNAEFIYKNSKDQEVSMVYEDLRQYIQSDDRQFKTGEKAHVSLFLIDCKKLESIKLTPEENSWTIEAIEGSLKLGAVPVNRRIDKEFTSDGVVQSLKNISITTSITVNGEYRGTTENNKKSVEAAAGQSVMGMVRVNADGQSSASPNDYTVTAEQLINEKTVDITRNNLYISDESGFRFDVPQNTTGHDVTYIITVSSVDNPRIKDVISVNVPAVA